MKPTPQVQPKPSPVAAPVVKPEPIRTALALYRDDGAWTLERLTVQGGLVVKRETVHAKDIKPIVLDMAFRELESTPL